MLIAFESYEQVIAAARAAQAGSLNEYLSANGLRYRPEQCLHREVAGTAMAYWYPKGGHAHVPCKVQEVSIDGGVVRRGRLPDEDEDVMGFCGLCVTKS